MDRSDKNTDIELLSGLAQFNDEQYSLLRQLHLTNIDYSTIDHALEEMERLKNSHQVINKKIINSRTIFL
jgi:hypothetical protein